MSKCYVDGCLSTNGIEPTGPISICYEHYTKGYRNNPEFHIDLIRVCNKCERNYTWNIVNFCSNCDSKVLKLNSDNFNWLVTLFQNELKRLRTLNSNITTREISTHFGNIFSLIKVYSSVTGSTEEMVKKALESIIKQSAGSAKENTMANSTSKSRRPSAAQLKQEAKKAAVQVAIQTTSESVLGQLPALLQKMGLSEDKAALAGLFLSSGPGKALFTSLLAAGATYIPVPAKYEEYASIAAEELRGMAMRQGGNAVIETLFQPLIEEFMKNFRKAEEAQKGLEILTKEVVSAADAFVEEATVETGSSARSSAKAR